MVLNAHRQGDAPSVRTTRIGPARIFGRLWEQLQIPQVIEQLLAGRHFTAPEESIFRLRRDLFSELELVFFDTTSIYFEGEGGAELGQYGHSKDHRPDRKQLVVGVVIDGQGRPLCCELWPGNVTDVKTLIPVVDRLRHRFRIRSICVVADRGMISKGTIAQLQEKQRNVHFILGARLRNVKEIYEHVLSRGGRYREVHPEREKSSDPSPLKVKEVHVDGYFTTDATKAVIGFAENQRCELGQVTIKSECHYAAIYVVAQEKDKNIDTSNRLLVVAIARARNTDMKIIDDVRLLDKGHAPILLEPVKAEITIRKKGAATVHVLDHAGIRTGKKLKPTNGAFTIDGVRDTTCYYLIEYCPRSLAGCHSTTGGHVIQTVFQFDAQRPSHGTAS